MHDIFSNLKTILIYFSFQVIKKKNRTNNNVVSLFAFFLLYNLFYLKQWVYLFLLKSAHIKYTVHIYILNIFIVKTQ